MKIKRKMYIVSVSGIFATLFLIIFVIRPNVQTAKQLYDKFGSVKQQINQLMASQSTNNLLLEQVSLYQPQLDEVRKSLPTVGEEVVFIEFLEKTSAKHRLHQTLNISQFEPSQSSEFSIPSTIHVTLQGDFLDVLDYLRSLELSPYYINIKTIAIKARPAESSKDVESANQELKTLVHVTFAAEIFWYQLQ